MSLAARLLGEILRQRMAGERRYERALRSALARAPFLKSDGHYLRRAEVHERAKPDRVVAGGPATLGPAWRELSVGSGPVMKLRARDAIIPVAKLVDDLLSATHPEGSSKAAFLSRLGYSRNDPQRLDADLRDQLTMDARPGRPSPYGQKYEILGLLTGPNGATGRIRTVSTIALTGETGPRLVTLRSRRRGHDVRTPPARRIGTGPARRGSASAIVGVIVEHDAAKGDIPEGYELEFFAAAGRDRRRRLGAGICHSRSAV